MIIDKKNKNDRIDCCDAVLDAWYGALLENEAILSERKANKEADDWLDLISRI